MTVIDMVRAAEISPCGLYRYRLDRIWDPDLPRAAWVMLNPSTADARRDDPTVRRILEFSRDAGMGSATVVNLFSLRATSPRDLLRATVAKPGGGIEHAIGGEAGRRAIADLPNRWGHAAGGRPAPLGLLVAAWGAEGRRYPARVREVRAQLREIARGAGLDVMCLGETKAAPRQPRHPLFVRRFRDLVLWGGRVR